MRHLVFLIACAGILCSAPSALAAPYIPADDSHVLERLPVKPGDPVARELRELRAALALRPDDPARADALARRYFDLAMAEGDPRYIGYAEATMRPWNAAATPPELLVIRGLLRQYRHDFSGALQALGLAIQADPADAEAHAWRAAIYMVQARYPDARAACEALTPHSSELYSTGCIAYVDATTGRTAAAYQRLAGALQRYPHSAATTRLWILTRLAEMAQRLEDPARAERHYREALALGIDDNFLLAAFADFLLDSNRPQEVVSLLKDWSRSDTLLLRLALGEHALGLPAAKDHIRALDNRFAEAALRGEQLHLQEEARFRLQLKGDAPGAVRLATENWKSQREPRDAAVLLEAALAAHDPRAAQPALDWLLQSGFENRQLRRLAGAIGAAAK